MVRCELAGRSRKLELPIRGQGDASLQRRAFFREFWFGCPIERTYLNLFDTKEAVGYGVFTRLTLQSMTCKDCLVLRIICTYCNQISFKEQVKLTWARMFTVLASCVALRC